MPLALLLTVLWGSTWPLFALALHEISVWTFRAVSVVAAGGSLLLWCRWKGHALTIPRRDWKVAAVSAVLYLGIWNIASTYSAILIPSGQAAMLGFTMPLWALLGARVFFGQRLDRRSQVALALSGAGVALLIARGWSAYSAAPAGFVLGLVAAIGWAAGTLLLKRHPVAAHGVALSGWQLLFCGVPIALVALVSGDRRWFVPDATTVLSIAYISLVPMGIGNAIWFSIVQRLPIQAAVIGPLVVPAVAMVAGALVHGEPLGPVEAIALGLSASGLALGVARAGPSASRARGASRSNSTAGRR